MQAFFVYFVRYGGCTGKNENLIAAVLSKSRGKRASAECRTGTTHSCVVAGKDECLRAAIFCK